MNEIIDDPNAPPPLTTKMKQDGEWKSRTRKQQPSKWEAHNEFEDYTARTLSLAEQAVWHHIWRDARWKNGTGFVSRTAQSKIAECKGMSVRHVKRVIQSLKQCGLLTVLIQGSNTRGVIGTYRIQSTRTGETWKSEK